MKRIPLDYRKAGGLAVAAGFLAVSLLVFEQILTSFAEQGAASGGALQNAALYPGLLAGVLALLALVQVVKLLGRGRPEEPGPAGGGPEAAAPGQAEWRKAAVCTAAFFAYVVLLHPLGYHLTTPVLLFVLYRTLGEKGVVRVAFYAVGTSLIASFFFERLLDVILPVGRFGVGF